MRPMNFSRPFGAIAFLCALNIASVSSGQTPTVSSAAPASPKLIGLATLPAPVRAYVKAFGDRITKPGSERTVLTGTYSAKGRSGAAEVTWEAPGSLRVVRADQPARALVYDSTNDIVRTSALTADDSEILETLLDDSAETFFYGFKKGLPYRLLGLGFRTDDGTTRFYTGPWVDVYASLAPKLSAKGVPAVPKLYHFDSRSGLLARTISQYDDGRDVVTEFTWQVINGQAFPAQIVRKVSGAPSFMLTVTGIVVSAAADDGTFSKQ